jgi:hypothetical protein
VTNIAANEPTSPTASGGDPLRIAGTTNAVISTSPATSPTSDSAPTRRPSRTTTATNASASHSSEPRRSKSTKPYGACAGSAPAGSCDGGAVPNAAVFGATRISSPGDSRGAASSPGMTR